MERDALERLVDRADVDGLLRLVDAGVDQGDWDGLLALRQACWAAADSGRQVWPAAAFAEYRLALDAPASWAAQVLVEGAGQFATGPLSEVAASSHRWDELAPHLGPGPLRTFLAHERVLRGEDLRGDARVDTAVLELPLVLAPFECDYLLPEFEAHRSEAPPPERPALSSTPLPAPARPADDPDSTHALRELVSVWTAESNGRVDIAAVEGDHLGAIAALGVPSVRVAEVASSHAMAWLAWAGASGGAHGRRRGGAAGRFSAWWVAAALGGVLDEWPLPADELDDVLAELRWFVWDANEPVLGWQLRLAAWEPNEGLGWAMAATDAS